MYNHIMTYRHCIIAAEMGTGKTLPIIEALEQVITDESAWYIGPKSGVMAVNLEFEKWDLVAETGDNYYLDREWNTLDNGEYRYAISAVYTADIFSPPLKTNKLIHDLDAIEPVYITKLYNNYPNPFNSSTTIEFSLESELPVSLQVFNLKGQLIDTLTEETYSQGKHSILWNGKHSKGKSVASGIYFFKMRAGGYSLTNKMVLIQ